MGSNLTIDFALYGENFDFDYITNKLNLPPTHTHTKGQKIKEGQPFTYKETSWEIRKEYKIRKEVNSSYDMNQHFNEFFSKLMNQADTINQLKIKYNLTSQVDIGIFTNTDEYFYLNFDVPLSHFFNITNTECHFHIYSL